MVALFITDKRIYGGSYENGTAVHVKQFLVVCLS